MCQSSDCTIIHEPLVTVISNLYFMLENLHCIRFYNDAKAIVNDHILVSGRISFECPQTSQIEGALWFGTSVSIH